MAEQENIKIFDLYESKNIEIRDAALRPWVNISAKLLVKSHGRKQDKYSSAKMHIIERFANRLGVPGHLGKKHRIITSWSSGKYNKNMGTFLKVLAILQEKTGLNPMQVLMQALENGSPRDEITVIESAGARYPQAVDCSPARRIALAVRWLVQGAYSKSFGKKNKMANALANEIMLAAKGSMDSYAVVKRNEAEKQADAAR